MESEAPATETVRRRRRRRRTAESRSHRVDRLAQAEWAIGIAAAAVALIFNVIAFARAGALWRDDAHLAAVAGAASLADVWRDAEFTAVPPAWLVVLHAWTAVGLGFDTALRLLGLAGGLALPAAVWFGLRRLTRSAPLVSLALVAVNPEIVRWGGSVSGWGLGAALGILVLVLLREASVALTRRRIAFASLAALLAVHTQYSNAVFVAAAVTAAASVAAARRRWTEGAVPVAVGAGALLTLLPYAGVWQRRLAWDEIARTPLALPEIGRGLWEVVSASGTWVATCWIALAALGLGAAVHWAASPHAESVNRSRRGVANYAAAACLAALPAMFVFLLATGGANEPWAFIGLLAFVAVGAEVAVASAVAARAARTTLVVLAGVVLVAGAGPAWSALREPQTNVHLIAARLEAEAVREDLIVVSPWFLAPSLTRAYAGAATVMTIPPLEDRSRYRTDLIREAMMAGDAVAPGLDRIRRTLESGARVWIVGGMSAPDAGTPAPPPAPPPRPGTGWNRAPYERAWSLQAGAFLQAHAVEGEEVRIGATGGRFENADLAVFRGWK